MSRPQEPGDCWEHPKLYARPTLPWTGPPGHDDIDGLRGSRQIGPWPVGPRGPTGCPEKVDSWAPSPIYLVIMSMLILSLPLVGLYARCFICTKRSPVSPSVLQSISSTLCCRQDWKSTQGWEHWIGQGILSWQVWYAAVPWRNNYLYKFQWHNNSFIACFCENQINISRLRQDSADLLTDVEKSLTVQRSLVSVKNTSIHIQKKQESPDLSSDFHARWRGMAGTALPSTRPTWSASTSGTTSSSATLAGRLPIKLWFYRLHNFEPFFRLETLLRHAHFSLQSRRLWRQFDIEGSVVMFWREILKKKRGFVDIFLTKGLEIERKNWRRTWLDG